MPEIRFTVSDEERDDIEKRARRLGMSRPEYLRSIAVLDTRPMQGDELHGLLAAKARQGNVRAMELLARDHSGKLTPETPAEDAPFADVIALAG